MEQPPAFAAHPQRVWSLSDARAGNLRQAQALAAALQAGPAWQCTLHARAPWRWAAPRRLPGAGNGAFGQDFARLPAPALAIGCGRQAALATRLLRARGSRVVQILDPRLDPAHWDFVVAPAHDRLQGTNVLSLLGSLNPVDDAWLAQALAGFPDVAALPGPCTALLLGGDSAHWRLDEAGLSRLAGLLRARVRAEGGSLLVTTSRRTPPALVAGARACMDGLPGLFWSGPADGPNPYAALLARADRIVCTPDSVNMVSEACATRVPVHVFEPGKVQGRPRLFLEALLQRGRIRAVDEALQAFAVEPLRETARVAAELRRRLELAPGELA